MAVKDWGTYRHCALLCTVTNFGAEIVVRFSGRDAYKASPFARSILLTLCRRSRSYAHGRILPVVGLSRGNAETTVFEV